MIAYSSVGHMGFVLLGFATLTPVGLQRRPVRQRRPRPDHRPAVLPRRSDQGAPRHRRHARARWRHAGASAAPRLPADLRLRSPRWGCRGWPGSGGRCSPSLGAFEPAAGLSRALFLDLHGHRRSRHRADRRLLPAHALPGHPRPGGHVPLPSLTPAPVRTIPRRRGGAGPATDPARGRSTARCPGVRRGQVRDVHELRAGRLGAAGRADPAVRSLAEGAALLTNPVVHTLLGAP